MDGERVVGVSGRPFPGRLVFDHFPKTAGQAINAWLAQTLGAGTVSPNIMGQHKDMLGLAGEFPVISGHIDFNYGENLDPRFQYATLLRDPIDRTISWLFFVTKNHPRELLPQLHDECMTYLNTEGDQLGPCLADAIINPMARHYGKILGDRDLEGVDLTEAAFRAIQSYHCIGTYERLPDFTAELAALIGIPAPAALAPVNVTNSRPTVDVISEKLCANLMEITQLDRELYARVSDLVAERLAANPPKPPKQSKWARYDRPLPLARTTNALTLLDVRPCHDQPSITGDIMRFELRFELHEHVAQLQAGLHIYDDRKRWAFGVNNVLLEQSMTDLKPGQYSITHLVSADLAAGNYSVGFAFDDVGASGPRSLYWHDALLQFSICRPEHSIGVGYANCLARMALKSELGPALQPAIHTHAIQGKLAANDIQALSTPGSLS